MLQYLLLDRHGSWSVHDMSPYEGDEPVTRLPFTYPPFAAALMTPLVFAVPLLLVALLRWRDHQRAMGTCVAALAMLVASRVSWSHHWVWALPIAPCCGSSTA